MQVQGKSLKGHETKTFDEMQAGLDYVQNLFPLTQVNKINNKCNGQDAERTIYHIS